MGEGIRDLKANDVFHMNVPYHEIKKIIRRNQDAIFQNLSPDAKKPIFEHVGSTSIKGMPGSLSPDILVLEETFPPSRSTVAAILGAGFSFKSIAPHDPSDFWFWKQLHDSPCKGEFLILHLMAEGNKIAKLFVLARDMCNSDIKAFEEYKQNKLVAKEGEGTTMLEYKIKKASGSFIARLRKQVGLPPHIQSR